MRGFVAGQDHEQDHSMGWHMRGRSEWGTTGECLHTIPAEAILEFLPVVIPPTVHLWRRPDFFITSSRSSHFILWTQCTINSPKTDAAADQRGWMLNVCVNEGAGGGKGRGKGKGEVFTWRNLLGLCFNIKSGIWFDFFVVVLLLCCVLKEKCNLFSFLLLTIFFLPTFLSFFLFFSLVVVKNPNNGGSGGIWLKGCMREYVLSFVRRSFVLLFSN